MTTSTITPGKLAVSTTGTRSGTVLTPAACEQFGFVTTPGTFVLNTGTSENPWFTFGRLTGRTRRQWGMDMPTIDRFEVETVVLTIDGRPTIMGVPGARIVGTFMTRPENVS